MYNAVLYDDVREFQEAMIETSSFMLTTAFFLGLSEWLDIDNYESPDEGTDGGVVKEAEKVELKENHHLKKQLMRLEKQKMVPALLLEL